MKIAIVLSISILINVFLIWEVIRLRAENKLLLEERINQKPRKQESSTLVCNLPEFNLAPKVSPALELRAQPEISGLDGPQIDFRPSPFASVGHKALVFVKINKVLSVATHLDL